MRPRVTYEPSLAFANQVWVLDGGRGYRVDVPRRWMGREREYCRALNAGGPRAERARREAGQ